MPAPTCFVCGHILSEFEWSSELNFFVQLKDPEIWDVVAYIRTLAVPPYKPSK